MKFILDILLYFRSIKSSKFQIYFYSSILLNFVKNLPFKKIVFSYEKFYKINKNILLIFYVTIFLLVDCVIQFFKHNFSKGVNWINVKSRGLNWTKVKAKNWNKFYSNLKGVICIFA